MAEEFGFCPYCGWKHAKEKKCVWMIELENGHGPNKPEEYIDGQKVKFKLCGPRLKNTKAPAI